MSPWLWNRFLSARVWRLITLYFFYFILFLYSIIWKLYIMIVIVIIMTTCLFLVTKYGVLLESCCWQHCCRAVKWAMVMNNFNVDQMLLYPTENYLYLWNTFNGSIPRTPDKRKSWYTQIIIVSFLNVFI